MRVTPLYLFALLALPGLSHAQVSLDHSVSTAKELMETLSAKFGTSYQVARALENEQVYVNVTNVSEEALRAQIAQAFEGEWQQREGGWTLTLPAAVSRNQVNRETDRVIARLRTFFNPPAEEDEDGTRPRMSFGSFATEVAKSIDLAEFASMDGLSRKVFSTKPTSMQQGLGAKVTELGAAYLETLRGQKERGDENSFASFIPSVIAPAGSKPAVVNLIVQRMGAEPGWTLNAILYGPNGEIYGMDFGFLAGMDMMRMQSTEQRIKFDKPAKVTIDPAWRALGSLISDPMMMGGFGGGFRIGMRFGAEAAAPGPAPDESVVAQLMKSLQKPGEVDPLELAWEPVLDQVVKAHQFNTVALLPDRLFNEFADYGGRGPERTTQDWLNQMARSMNMEVMLDGSTLTIRSETPASDRVARVNRGALQTLIGRIAEKESMLLADLAQYAEQKPGSPAVEDLDVSVLRSLGAPFQLAANQIGDASTLPMLRYFARMTPQQRDAMNQNRPMPIRGLHPAQQDVVKALTFHTMEGPQRTDTQPGGRRGGGRNGNAEAARDEMFRRIFALENERTVAFSNGLPPMSVVRTSFSSNTAVAGGAGANSRLMNSWDVAVMNASQQNAQLAAMAPSFKPTKFRPFAQNNFVFRFELGGGWVLTRTLSEMRPIEGKGYGSYDALPEDFRRETKEMEEMMSRGMMQVRRSGGGVGGAQGP